jgi:hypothetical protein
MTDTQILRALSSACLDMTDSSCLAELDVGILSSQISASTLDSSQLQSPKSCHCKHQEGNVDSMFMPAYYFSFNLYFECLLICMGFLNMVSYCKTLFDYLFRMGSEEDGASY